MQKVNLFTSSFYIMNASDIPVRHLSNTITVCKGNCKSGKRDVMR
jgi:hypothetical protein